MSSAPPPPPQIIMVGGGNRPAPASTNTIPAWAWVLVAIIIIGFGIFIALKWKGQTCTPKDSDKVANANTYVYNKTSFVSNCVVSNCLDGYNLLNGICSQVIDDPGTTPAPAADPGTVPSDGTDPGTAAAAAAAADPGTAAAADPSDGTAADPSDGTDSAETKCTSQKATGNIQGWAYDSTKGCTIQCNSGFTGTNCENGTAPDPSITLPLTDSTNSRNLKYGDYVYSNGILHLYNTGYFYITDDKQTIDDKNNVGGYPVDCKMISFVPADGSTSISPIKNTDYVIIVDVLYRRLLKYSTSTSLTGDYNFTYNTTNTTKADDTYKFKLSFDKDGTTLILTPKSNSIMTLRIPSPQIVSDVISFYDVLLAPPNNFSLKGNLNEYCYYSGNNKDPQLIENKQSQFPGKTPQEVLDGCADYCTTTLANKNCTGFSYNPDDTGGHCIYISGKVKGQVNYYASTKGLGYLCYGKN